LESVLSSLRKSYPTILIQRSSEDHHLNPTVLPNSPENTENHSNEESHTPTSLRHRENIGRIGSPGVFCEMSVIAAFPLKTGNLMFVGFDSQNTSHSFPHYPNWNLGISGNPINEFRGGQRMKGILLGKMMNCFLHRDVKTDGETL
jgi:hypothetical protein